jgi:hypothetical protein
VVDGGRHESQLFEAGAVALFMEFALLAALVEKGPRAKEVRARGLEWSGTGQSDARRRVLSGFYPNEDQGDGRHAPALAYHVVEFAFVVGHA